MKGQVRTLPLVILAIAIIAVSGCGNLYRINYSNIKADLNYGGSRTVAVGVVDKRPYVLSGESDPRYVGTMRGGYGNPFDLWTQSGLNLSDDMAATIAESLKNKGFKVVAVKASVGKDDSKMMADLKASGADRIVYLSLIDWWSNYYPKSFGAEKTELIMNVELKVMDRKLKTLGSKRLKEIAIPPSGWPKDTIPGMYQKKMTELLNDRGIQKALK